jgi:hypothetical protein
MIVDHRYDNARPWARREDDFLRNKYAEIGAQACSEYLDRSVDCIYQRAHHLGCTKLRRGSVSHRTFPPAAPKAPVTLPGSSVLQSHFIRPLTKAQLMRGKA